jgi:hypothetical protein
MAFRRSGVRVPSAPPSGIVAPPSSQAKGVCRTEERHENPHADPFSGARSDRVASVWLADAHPREETWPNLQSHSTGLTYSSADCESQDPTAAGRHAGQSGLFGAEWLSELDRSCVGMFMEGCRATVGPAHRSIPRPQICRVYQDASSAGGETWIR